MANFPTRAHWHTQIRRIEAGDSVIGGENAPINLCLGGLAERSDWLKTEIARTIALIGTNQTAADQKYALKNTQINAGAGLTGGGLLRDNSTISMGTPSKITATSQNSAVSNTHTHEIDKASTSIAGIVRLSSATDSTAENLAATPRAVKQLADLIGATGSASFPQRGALGGRNLNDLHGSANYGIWYQAADAGAITSLNYPVQIAGTLFVLPSAYAGVQLYIPYSRHEIYIRNTSGNNGGWTSWRINGEVVNTLTSDSTTAALSAAQGKWLAEKLAKAHVFQDMRGSVPGSSPPVAFQDATPAQLPEGVYQGLSSKSDLNGGGLGVMTTVKGWRDRTGHYSIYREGCLPNGEIWRQYANSNLSGWQARARVDGADWSDIRSKPDTFAGYGLTGSQTYNGQLTFASGNYPAVILSPANSQNNWHWEASGEGAYFIHRAKTGANVKIISLPARAGTLALDNETVNLAGNQTINGQKAFANQLKINGGAVMTYGGWSNRLQFDGGHAAITLAGRYAIGLHSNGNLYLFDNEQRAYGLTYNYAAKSLNVGGEITSGSHHLTRKADRATTLAGYGITDGVTPAQLQAAVAGIVSSSPAALDTLRELAAALGNDPNYAATTARKLGEAAPSGTVAWFAGNTAPAGWLKANGAAVSRTAYAALFAAIGTTYGTGDGRTTFNLPDLRGEFVRGWDDGRGVDMGRVFGWRQGDAIRNITGTLDTGAESNLQFVDYAESSGAFGILRRYKRWTSDAGGGNDAPSGFNFDASRVVPTASENRPRNIALLGIIKI